MKNETLKLVLSAVFTAVSVVICILSGAFPSASLALCASCGIVTMILITEAGYKYTILMYIATSILTLILCPNKECAIYYIFLFGHYPLLKMYFERIKSKVLLWIVKVVTANVLCASVLLIVAKVIGISDIVGIKELVITMILYNVAFVLYDICLGRIILFYIFKRTKKGRFR